MVYESSVTSLFNQVGCERDNALSIHKLGWSGKETISQRCDWHFKWPSPFQYVIYLDKRGSQTIDVQEILKDSDI